MELNDWRLLVWRCVLTVVMVFLMGSLGVPLLMSVGLLNEYGLALLALVIGITIWRLMPCGDPADWPAHWWW